MTEKQFDPRTEAQVYEEGFDGWDVFKDPDEPGADEQLTLREISPEEFRSFAAALGGAA